MTAVQPALWELTGRSSDDRAVTDARRSLSWGSLDAGTNAVGHGLGSLGLVPGDHVAVVATNRVEFVVALLGALRAGMVVTPVKTGWTADEVAYVLGDAGTAAVITDTDAGRAAAASTGVALVDLDDGFDAWLTAQPVDPLPSDRSGSRMSYTSGTTGRPKGVRRRSDGTRPFAESFAASAMWARVLHVPADGPHLIVSALYHGAPLTFGLSALASGAPLTLLDRWSPAAGLSALAGGAASTCLVPSMFRELLAMPAEERAAHDLSGVRTVVHGGEPCPPALKAAVLDWLPHTEVVEYYGFTEGGMTVATTAEWRARPGTVGRPLPPARIVVLDDDGAELPPGEIGGVYARLPAERPFEYRNDPAKTDAAYRGGAFTAGDVGWLDEDGWLYLCGRSADVIVSAGVNVYPAQVEAALADLPAVADVCVVAGPHEVRGEQPVAFVVAAAGFAPDHAVSVVEAAAVERLGSYQRPRDIRVVASLPRDGTGKVLRRALQEPLWEGVERFAVARR